MEKNKTRELLRQKEQEYKNILSIEDPDVINKVMDILYSTTVRVKENGNEKIILDIETMDDDVKRIFELQKQFEQDIKQIFVENKECITHITQVPPEDIRGGKISVSKNRANNYETERGDWVFASSNPMDGNNPYIARSNQGMIIIAEKAYVYGGDNMQVTTDNQGNRHVVLKNPNYVYMINPENFTPVVRLMKDKQGMPFFDFSEEWFSEKEVDINDLNQIRGVEEISDITELIRRYQVFCDVGMTGEAMYIRSSYGKAQGIERIKEGIRSGRLRYINGEAKINYYEYLEKEIEGEQEK